MPWPFLALLLTPKAQDAPQCSRGPRLAGPILHPEAVPNPDSLMAEGLAPVGPSTPQPTEQVHHRGPDTRPPAQGSDQGQVGSPWVRLYGIIAHMIRAAVLFLFVYASCATGAESKPIPLRSTDRQFQEFIASVKVAARVKDSAAVYALLAQDYYISRDFGGSFDPAATPVQNFSVHFEFDNARLRPEYRDLGWVEFRRAVSGQTFEQKIDGQLCTPYGALDKKPFPQTQLCFRKHQEGWKIQGHINGGD